MNKMLQQFVEMFVYVKEDRLTVGVIERLFRERFEIRGDVMEYLIAICVRNLFISAEPIGVVGESAKRQKD